MTGQDSPTMLTAAMGSEKLLLLLLMLASSPSDAAAGQAVFGCPMMGCTPAQSFSLAQGSLPDAGSVGLLWNTTISTARPPPGSRALGCVGNREILICPATDGHGGYVGLSPIDGTLLWTDKVLRRPSLPILNMFGDAIGTDGNLFVLYLRDGTLVPPAIRLDPSLRPAFSMTLASENILVITSTTGRIVTYGPNGIVKASIYLYGTANGIEGMFNPRAMPAFSGNRGYFLTIFSSDQLHTPTVLRLYAIDFTSSFAPPRIAVRWHVDLFFSNKSVEKLDQKLLKVVLSVSCADNRVLVNFGDRASPGSKNEEIPSTVWGIVDKGDSGEIIYKMPFGLESVALHTVQGGHIVKSGYKFGKKWVDKELFMGKKYITNLDTKLQLTRIAMQHPKMLNLKPLADSVIQMEEGEIRPQPSEEAAFAWAVSMKDTSCILGLDMKTGKTMKSIKVSDLLGHEAYITSHLTFVLHEASGYLVFGVEIYEGDQRGAHLVAIDSDSGKLVWHVHLGESLGIKGQIIGYPVGYECRAQQHCVAKETIQFMFYVQSSDSGIVFAVGE